MNSRTGALALYSIFSTMALAIVVFTAASAGGSASFTEIDVERINIVESDGTLRMVISNQDRQHPGIVDGDTIRRSGPRPPGMLFFNHLGDEMGGLVFGENGDVGHFGSLTFDKVRNDQTIGFRYLESDNGRYHAGLEVWQQPDIPAPVMAARYEAADTISDPVAREAAIQALLDDNALTTRRLFLGKLRNDATMLELLDIKGRPRIRLSVQPDGPARLEFLDEQGEVVYSVPGGMD